MGIAVKTGGIKMAEIYPEYAGYTTAALTNPRTTTTSEQVAQALTDGTYESDKKALRYLGGSLVFIFAMMYFKK